MNRSAIELVVFDWDGTIMDSQARIVASLRAAIASVGLPVRDDDVLRDTIGLGLPQALMGLFPELGVREPEALIRAYREQFVQQGPSPGTVV